MKAFASAFLLVSLLALSACGSHPANRMTGAALIGGGIGMVIGAPVAFAIGAAAIGGITNKDHVNLGEPPWYELIEKTEVPEKIE